MMTFWTLVRRSLRFHARAHFGVLLGATIGSATLIGALLVGDSVRESLRELGLERLGKTHFALVTQDRFFLNDLGERLGTEPSSGYARLGRRCRRYCCEAQLRGRTVKRAQITSPCSGSMQTVGLDLLAGREQIKQQPVAVLKRKRACRRQFLSNGKQENSCCSMKP